jgi:hypothetical protein
MTPNNDFSSGFLTFIRLIIKNGTGNVVSKMTLIDMAGRRERDPE